MYYPSAEMFFWSHSSARHLAQSRALLKYSWLVASILNGESHETSLLSFKGVPRTFKLRFLVIDFRRKRNDNTICRKKGLPKLINHVGIKRHVNHVLSTYSRSDYAQDSTQRLND